MDESTIDLRDRRGRLIRLALAVTVGVLVAMVVYQWLEGVAVTPSSDPITKSSIAVTMIGVWVVASGVTLAALAGVTRWARGRRAGSKER